LFPSKQANISPSITFISLCRPEAS
jgi:hypothetical protein